MEEKNKPKIKYNKRMLIGGLSLLLVAISFLFCSFFLAENLAAYFGITFILVAFAGTLIAYSGFFGEIMPGIIISVAVLISGLFLFCFSMGKGETNSGPFGSQVDIIVNADIETSINNVIVTPSESQTTTNTSGPTIEAVYSSSAVTSSNLSSSSSQKTSSSSVRSSADASNVKPSSAIPNNADVDSSTRPASSVFSVYPQSQDIVVLSELSFKRNQIATVSAKGKPNTPYSIEVHYSSGKSTAAGLEPKTSDSNGNVSWSFKVGGRTKPGQYKLIISDGIKSAEFNFTVE